MDDFEVPDRIQFINKPFNRLDRIARNNFTIVTWVVNHSCPFKCWYCPESVHNGSNNLMDWNEVDKFTDILLEKYPSILFALSGGEPSTWPHISNLLEKLKHKDVAFGINSNLIRTLGWWERYVDNFAYISASYHPSVLTTKEQRLEFFEKCRILSQRTCVTVRLMMDPNHWDHCMDIYNIHDSDIDRYSLEPVRILELRQGGANIDYFKGYSEEQETIINLLKYKPTNIGPDTCNDNFWDFNKVTYDDGTSVFIDHLGPLMFNKVNKFNGWKCNIGIESLYINEKGWIKRGNCSIGGFIGTIKETDKIKWPANNPVVCNIDMCHCFTDIKITKWKE